MPCTSPLDAWPPGPGAPDRRFVFSPRKSYAGAVPLKLPCGHCRACKLERAGELAIRAVHEAQMFERQNRGSIFITLTFDDAHLPKDRSVSVPFIQRFNHRLRKTIGPFRFLLGAEYGDAPGYRPHYHMCLFGHDFRGERYLWKTSPTGGLLYRAPTLERVWTFGHCLFSDFTRETGGYTARYTTKKVGGDEAEPNYRRVDDETGEVWQVRPEFMLSSRNPGLGASWFDAFKDDVFPCDHLVIDGRQVPVPRYYLNRLPDAEREAVQAARIEAGNKAAFARLHLEEDLAGLTREERAAREANRRQLGRAYRPDSSDARLLAKHESQDLRARRLVRSLDAEMSS